MQDLWRVCSCKESYVSETIRNVETRWGGYNAPRDKPTLSKQLNENITHIFSWKVVCNAPKRKLTCKILEAYFIATMKLALMDQIESDLLHLFRNGII